MRILVLNIVWYGCRSCYNLDINQLDTRDETNVYVMQQANIANMISISNALVHTAYIAQETSIKFALKKLDHQENFLKLVPIDFIGSIC